MYEFKGFTQKANTALNIAIESAEQMGHTYIGTEHILLGLIKEGSGVAAEALSQAGLTADALENKIKESVGTAMPVSLSANDFTPRSKRVMQNAVMIASRLGKNYVGTEHLLISLMQETDSYAYSFLSELGVRRRQIQTVIQRISTSSAATSQKPLKRARSTL